MLTAPLDLASMSTRTKASLVHDLLTEAVEAEFSDDDVTRFVQVRGLKQLITRSARIRFKKLNRRLLVSSNRTRQSQSWVQLPMHGLSPLLSLTFGYRPDPLWSRIEVAGLALQVGNTVPLFLEVQSADNLEDPQQGDVPAPFNERGIRVKRHVVETRQAELFGDETNLAGSSHDTGQ